ncbi:MAG TPA: hypothetical protein ENN81_05095, partial [Phycisphaerales bacterium]|nr:hypothetical protein [Phycisphaerales bacterium]
MVQLPFQLDVRVAGKSGRTQTITCQRVLREVPGSRVVYEGLWGDRPVVAKVFRDRFKGPGQRQREWKTLGALRDRGLDAPEPLFQGQTADEASVLVQELIGASRSAEDEFSTEADPLRRVELLVRLCTTLAGHHEKGVLQEDLHLGNFLLANDRVVALDPGRMRLSSGPVPRAASLSNLALLACSLFATGSDDFRQLLDVYCRARGWKTSPEMSAAFLRQVDRQRRRQIQRSLRKCMRTNRRHRRVQGPGWQGMFDRGFIEDADAGELVKSMDRLMEAGEVLKSGHTCYVSRVKWNGRDVVVKRFNHRGAFHSLRQGLKGSRARRAWGNGHRLAMLGIHTPKPLAYVERYAWGLLYDCYLITECLDGCNLYLYLTSDAVSEGDKARMASRIRRMMDGLTRHHISHGDLKYANVFVVGAEPYLMDLDSIIVHWLALTQRIWM